MGNIDLAALEIFKAVVEESGITKAATRLNRVPSNVTTRVKQLEERLGTQLFRPRESETGALGGGQAPARLRRPAHPSREAEAALRSGRRPARSWGPSKVRRPPDSRPFSPASPAVSGGAARAGHGHHGALIAKVMDHEVEAAFVAEPFTANDLDGLPVFSEELVLITPKSFRRIKTPRDIGRTTLIAFAAGCSYRRRLEGWLGDAKVVPERVLEFGSYHAIVACVAAGAGIAIVPRSVIRVSLASADVATCALPAAVAKARTFLVWRQGHQSILLDAMREEIRRATGTPPSDSAALRGSRPRAARGTSRRRLLL